jgi:hypothetical protein
MFWISLTVSMFFFFAFTSERTLENFGLTILISLLYTVVLGGGNGLLNSFLNKRFPWSENTSKRATISIVSIIIANIILVYFCNYINFVVIQKGLLPRIFLR